MLAIPILAVVLALAASPRVTSWIKGPHNDA